MLYRMIEADRLSSVIFFGPPGTGKTSLARLIANVTKVHFVKINAVSSGIAEIKKIVADTQNFFLNPAGRTLLFIDEIHRFNKAQQDALLPYVEDGTIILIGATTENPFFEVNKAIISRSTVFQLYPLNAQNIKNIIWRAVRDRERGYGDLDIQISEEALNFIAEASGGDARIALNALELAVLTSGSADVSTITITLDTISECVQKKAIRFDKSGEAHYDNISAFIKSMRGSDPDAAVFYLARALEGGEDINFLARRIVICASEDVGTANPTALLVAEAAASAVRMIGMPEARILLSQAAITVGNKSKIEWLLIMQINAALEDIRTKNTGEVPLYLRNAVTKEMGDLGYGEGYRYVHEYPGNVTQQQFLPDEVSGTKYYKPYGNGYEKKIMDYLEWKKEMINKNESSTDVR